MNNSEFFEKYITDNDLPKTLQTYFNRITKNIQEKQISKVNLFKIENLEIENFGNIQQESISFKNKVVKFTGAPKTGKTARIEAIIYALFGINKTNSKVSNFDSKTNIALTLTQGKNSYKIIRTNNNGQNNCKIFINNSEEAEVSGQTECNAFIEQLINIDYETFVETFYSGDLSIFMHKKNPIDIKKRFISLFDNEYWESVNAEAKKKMKEIELEIHSSKTIIESIQEIAGANVEDLKNEFKENESIIVELEKITQKEIDTSELKKKEDKLREEKNHYFRQRCDKEQVEKSLKYNESVLSVIKREGRNLWVTASAAQISINKLNQKIHSITEKGKSIKAIIDALSTKTCPILNQECTTITQDFIDKKIEERESLIKDYNKKTQELMQASEDMVNAQKQFHSLCDRELDLEDKNFIDNFTNELEELIEDDKKIIETHKRAEEKIINIDEKIDKIHKEIYEILSFTKKEQEQLAELKARNEVIEKTLKQFKEAESKVKNIKKKEKEQGAYETIYKITQRNRIPKEQSFTMTKKVNTKIKSFCKDILDFSKYEFDEDMNLIVDGKPFRILNSASKYIIDIAFRHAIAQIITGSIIPMMLFDDISLFQDDTMMKKLIQVVENIKAKNIIYASNRVK